MSLAPQLLTMPERDTRSEDQIITFLRTRDYALVRELGSGACGRTVLLHDPQIDEHFVCKKYAPFTDSLRSELFANFAREIKLLHKVYHPNIVRVFNYFLYPDKFTGFILMEHVDGENIDKYVAQNPSKISDLFLQTLNGFEHLERSGILHRDIRVGNLMVTNDGLLKIIDLGFGKKVDASKDFDKSITLNWWCETPNEFDSARYDFATEVYFVGKLFEKLIRENKVEHFHYPEALRRMCVRTPEERSPTFSSVLQDLRNDQFPEIDFSDDELEVYRSFANALSAHITKIETGTKYFDDMQRIIRQLRSQYQKWMLEEDVPDAAYVTRCFIDGSYYYKVRGFSVAIVRSFIDLVRRCSAERANIMLANLHSRLDQVPRYDEGENKPRGDDIPF